LRFLRRSATCVSLFALISTLAFAQTSSFGQAAQGIATEMIAMAKWLGIILCIACGIGIYAGGHGAIGKVAGLFVGLIFALFPAQIVSWVQSL
jgi:type IV secretory pathway VirB2 component (pilin)